MTEEPPITEACTNRRAVLGLGAAVGAALLGTPASGDAAQAASRHKPPAIVIIGAGVAGAVPPTACGS